MRVDPGRFKALANRVAARMRRVSSDEQAEVQLTSDEFCHECGTEVPSTWKFCRKCGALMVPSQGMTPEFVPAETAGVASVVPAPPSPIPPAPPLPSARSGRYVDGIWRCDAHGIKWCKVCARDPKAEAPTATAPASGDRDAGQFRNGVWHCATHDKKWCKVCADSPASSAASGPPGSPGPAPLPDARNRAVDRATDTYRNPPTLPPSRTSGSATTALVLGLLGICTLGPILGIPAIIIGNRARREILQSDGALVGDGMAIAGIALGWIATVVTAVTLTVLIGVTVAGSNA